MLKIKGKQMIAGMLSMCMIFGMLPSAELQAANQKTEVKITEEQLYIGNDSIGRSISIQDEHALTTLVENKIADTSLVPQAGSEDFVISTLVPVITEAPEEGDTELVAPTEILDRSAWTVSITNGYGTAFDAAHVAKMIDGNLSTNPDEWSKPGHPFYVDIDLGSVQTVRSMSIDKRPGYTDAAYGTNGTMGKFELYVSDDGENYVAAGQGEFTKDAYNLHEADGLYNVGDRVYANFDKTYETRYVRVVQTSVAFGSAEEFTTAELNLFADEYVGPNWNTTPDSTDEIQKNVIKSSELIFESAEAKDLEDGAMLTVHYDEYEVNDVLWDIDQVFVLKDDNAYMHSFLEIKVSDENRAQIDYIDTDRFVFAEDVEGLWSRPEDSKISSMWIGKHELMLGQPIYANAFYMGSEFPAADTILDGDTAQIRYYSGKTFAKLKEDDQLTTDGKFVSWQNVIGAAAGTDTAVVQTDFFQYIEEIATPTDFRKQYNSWYDNMMNITDKSIAESFYGAEAGLTQNGVEPLDSYVVDDGWNNYYDGTYTATPGSAQGTTPNRTGFWEFNAKFPNELYTSSALADKFQSTFGVWVGPQGGYNYFGSFAQYLEAMGTGEAQTNSALGRVVCTGSRKYLDNFETMAIDYQNRFNVEYWKWDGFASRPCDNSDHDHMTGGDNNMYFTSDMWEAWIDLFDHVRENNPNIFINATCYVNLSPWLLQWVNTVWVQDSGDTGELGTGERHEQKIYYRDQVYYQLYKQNQVQFPLKNIYNHDPIYGVSDGSDATTEVFREFLMANAVRGTAFWELYYSPSIMDEDKWMVTADALAFAEENHDVLKNAKLFGNQPRNGVYGYSCWNQETMEGIVSFTNPLSSEQEYTLTMDEIVGVPKGLSDAAGIQVEPYVTDAEVETLSYGDTLTVTLQPHETLILQYAHEDETVPQLVSAKATSETEVTVKFNERIVPGTFEINGAEVEAQLQADYRTVILKSESSLEGSFTVAVQNLKDAYGNETDLEEKVTYYPNGVIAELEVLYGGETTLSTEHTLTGANDFTVNVSVETTDAGVKLFESAGEVTLSIDEEGFAVFSIGTQEVSSKEEVITVVEKAHGLFGSEEYVPTSTTTEVTGKINDGEQHFVCAVREANGMLKIYIDGTLAASAYEENTEAEVLQGGKMTAGIKGFEGTLVHLQVLNYAADYVEADTMNPYGEIVTLSDREGWTANACSEMSYSTGDSTAMAAIDGSSASWWHTNYVGGDSHSYGTHWISVDFGKAETFDQFIYLGRGAGTNGSIKDYRLELLAEDGTVLETFEGSFSSADAETVVDLGASYEAYGFKLTAVSTHNGQNFAAAVELNIAKTTVKAPELPEKPAVTVTPEPTEAPEKEAVTEVFDDVYADWYVNYVQYVYDNGLMTGIKGTKNFEPNANITKAQVAQVLYNMEGQPEVTDKKVFTSLRDVYEAEWYANAVAWAFNTGVVTGDLNTKQFNPNANVTREQLALMMFRYADFKGYDVTAASDYEGLVGAENISNWAANGVSWAVGAGLISGVEKDGVKDIAPQGNATRAQVAAILQRFCENLK